ncbi:hypothetical protein BJY01DRAFT_214926 [Aspergillus pseudoustus]|uniref:Uncharacterized protein n=1 Tax=Aspergillus pseudoustus TaxID=1810923 RepID=A0ABR4JWQ6_9EURO
MRARVGAGVLTKAPKRTPASISFLLRVDWWQICGMDSLRGLSSDYPSLTSVIGCFLWLLRPAEGLINGGFS